MTYRFSRLNVKEMKELIKGDYCVIKWRDSNIYYEQIDVEQEGVSVEIINTVGYLLEKTHAHIVVARDRIRNEHRGVIVIPKENISEAHFLEEGNAIIL